jgi:hypothetical protein
MINMVCENINFEWRWNHWPLSGNVGIAKVIVEEHFPPTENDHGLELGVEVPDSSKLSILIRLSTDDNSRRRTDSSQESALHDKILPQVDHVTVIIAMKNGSKLDEHLWFNIFLLSKALASRSPHLTTLRVVAQESEVVFDACAADTKGTRESSTTHEFFPTPYESLVELPLRKGATQCAQLRQTADRRNNMTVQKPAHARIDSSMRSNMAMKESEWVYSSVDYS